MANMWDAAAYDDFNQQLMQSTAMLTGQINNLGAAIGDYKSQKEYNKLQRELASERNALEREEFEKSLAWEREKLLSEQSYASFANQLAMARSAGVNPLTAVNNQAVGGSSGTPGRSSFQSPNQVVEDGFAKGIRSASDFNIQAVRELAASRKDNADATAQNIDNVVRSVKNARELEGMGLHNEAQQILNERNSALSPLVVENQELENQHLAEMNEVLRLEQGLKQFDLSVLKPKEYEKLLEDTRLVIQKQITEAEYREHLKRYDRNEQTKAAAQWLSSEASMYNAQTNRHEMGSRIAQNFAIAKYYDEASKKEKQMTLNLEEITALNNLAVRMRTTENDIYQQYAHFNAWYENNILRNKSQMSEYDVKMSYQQYLMNQKHLNWYDANQVVNMLIPIKYGSSSTGDNLRGQKPIWEDYENRKSPTMGSDGMLNHGNGVYEDSKGWLYNAQTGQWVNPAR